MTGKKTLIVKLKLRSSTSIAEALQAPANSPSNQAAPARITTHFSQSQLALALAIQKAKPEELSTNGMSIILFRMSCIDLAAEYCQQLRESIKSGQPIALGTLRYIDTSEFWKEQYTKILLEKKELEDKVHQLEEAQRQLQENPHRPNDSSYINLNEGHQVFDPVGDEGSRKRPAQSAEDEMEEDGQAAFSLHPVDKHFLTMNSYGNRSIIGSLKVANTYSAED